VRGLEKGTDLHAPNIPPVDANIYEDAEEQESWSGYERCMTYTIFALFVVFILAFVYYLAMIAG